MRVALVQALDSPDRDVPSVQADVTHDTPTRLQRYSMPAGEMGSAGGQTLIAALLPILLAPHAPATFLIGAVIATEGLFALVLPYVAGAATDSLGARIQGRLGRRGLLLALAAPPMALALVLMPFRDSFWTLAGTAVVYFAALHLYATPLRALLIESTPEHRWGAVQGVLGAMHLGGVAFGLIAGGLLFSIWEPLPFLVGAGLIAATTAITLVAARHGGDTERGAEDAEDAEDCGQGDGQAWRMRDELRFWRDLLRDREARRFLAGNILWNAGTEGIRPYIFLFATVVLGVAIQTASLALLGFLGAAGVGSLLVGHYGDRFGRRRLLLIGAVVTGLAMMPGMFVRDLLPLILLLLPAGLGAAALVSLPYPVFEEIVNEEDVGRSTGTFFASVGIARLVAPLLVGAAIDGARAWLPNGDGYPIMWPVAGTLILMGALMLWLAGKAGRGRRHRRQAL
ncbi:MAG TPA: MFS transporter [Longimicrobiales bacterium]|nr:MFS transporter [Longimicrobiales bacterium]